MVFVLDASGSVHLENFEKMKNFTKNLLSGAANIDGGKVRVGMNVYSTDSIVEFHLKDYKNKNDIFDAIDALHYQAGGTYTGVALKRVSSEMFTVANGDRPDVNNIAFVVTDGQSTDDPIPVADALRDHIKIYAVGIGLDDTTELEGIAHKPAKDNVFTIDDFDKLEGLEKQVFAAICGKAL